MTYALGARCKDGVVITADRRIFDGTEFREGSKIFSSNGILVAASGYTAIIEKLHEKMDKIITGNMDYIEKIETIENIIHKLNHRYIPRILMQEMSMLRLKLENKEIPLNVIIIDALVALKDNKNQVKLYHINPNGIAQIVKEGDYCAVGNGEPYGAVFLKKNWEYYKNELRGIFEINPKSNEDEYSVVLPFNAIDSASLFVFAILMVEDLEVNQFVGDGINVWVFEDGKEPCEIKEGTETYDDMIEESGYLWDDIKLGQDKEELEKLMEKRRRWGEKKSKSS